MRSISRMLVLLIALSVCPFSSYSQFNQSANLKSVDDKQQFDSFGRLIYDNGRLINYDYSEEFSCIGGPAKEMFSAKGNPNPDFSGSVCDPVWFQATMGSCIGQRSMNSADFNNDGKTEILCSSGGYYWYFLEYNSQTNDYEIQWISEYYDSYSEEIHTIEYFDLGADGSIEILCGFENGIIRIYNGSTRELITTIESSADGLQSIIHADGDNDGSPEIICCDEDNTYFFNEITYDLEHTIEYGADNLRSGNVDSDDYIEIVYSTGDVLSFDGNAVTYKWDFNNEYYGDGLLELSDIDSDGMKEIIYSRYWYIIQIFDANSQELLNEIGSSMDIAAILMADVNGDGIDELLYGEGQWGKIYCHNPNTTSLLWSIDNPDHGVTEINVADVDDDGTLEILWGAGCSSSGSDHLHICEIPSGNPEFTSKHIDPPFYSVELADVDDDGTPEIVTLSYESNSGYDSGILTVFSAEDHKIEWQSDEEYFENVWTGMFAMEIDDIDEDGETEIIVAAGRTYTGQLWIINGHTYEIESNYIFDDEDFEEFYSLDVADVDGDGVKECIVGEDWRVHVIDPNDFSVEWSKDLPGYNRPKTIHTGNVDSGPEQEVVVCAGYIYVIDGTTQEEWHTEDEDYTNFDLVDINDDGVQEIIACTSTGLIVSIDGETQQVTILVDKGDIQIDGISLADLTMDGLYEYIFTSEGSVFFEPKLGSNCKPSLMVRKPEHMMA